MHDLTYEEHFTDELTANHRTIIVSVSVASGAALLSAVLLVSTKGRKLRLPLFLAVALWAVIMIVSLAVWHETYNEAREVIQRKSRSLLTRSGRILDQVLCELRKGPEIVSLFARQIELDQNPTIYGNPFPSHALYLASLQGSFGLSAGQHLYWGTTYGGIHGSFSLKNDSFTFYTAFTDVEDLRSVPIEGGMLCTPRYDVLPAAQCAAYVDSPGCNSNASLDWGCPKSCKLPAHRDHCVLDPVAGFAGGSMRVHMTGGGGLVASRFSGMNLADYDPRTRPWYRTDREVSWGSPYKFHQTKGVGITASAGVFNHKGELMGAVAADFTFESLVRMVRMLPPTPNSLWFVTTLDYLLISTSVSPSELAPLIAPQTMMDIVNVTLIADDIASPISFATRSLLSTFGSFTNLVGERVMLVRKGRVVASFFLEVRGGLKMIVVLELPYKDLMGSAEAASTNALLIALGIAVGVAAVFCMGVVFILRPLTQLAADMDQVAWMQLDELPNRRVSFVREISWMQHSFQAMVLNLVEYKKYLPTSILESNDDDEETCTTYSGTVMSSVTSISAAIVFTDICGSTSLWERVPACMRTGLRVHNAIIRELINKFNGYEVKTIGDAFMVAFSEVREAVQFGLEVHERLLAAAWPEDLLAVDDCARTDDGAWGGMRLRIGCYVGEVEIETNHVTNRKDYFGTTVNKASRLETCCMPGGVAIAKDMLASNQLPNTYQLDLGSVLMKGIGMVNVVVFVPRSLEGRYKCLSESLAAHKGNLLHSTDSRFVDTLRRCKFRERLHHSGLGTTGRIDIHFTESLLDSKDDAAARVTEQLQHVSQCVQRSNGDTVSVIGCSVVAGWNVTKACLAHQENAVRCVPMLHRTSGVRIHMGIATGMSMHGNVAGTSQRFVTVFGPCVQLSAVLATAALRFGTTCLYVALGGSQAFFGSEQVLMRPVDNWRVDNQRSLRVFEVRDDFSQPDDWGWTHAFADAVYTGNYESIGRNCTYSPHIQEVVDMLREGRHLCDVVPALLLK